MGREWYWGAGKSSKRGGTAAAKSRLKEVLDIENANTTPGCMCSVFQLFDFYQFQIPSSQQQQDQIPPSNLDSSLLDDPSVSKGSEAPRNSLELEEPTSPTILKQEDDILNIPMGIQIKTNGVKNSKSHGGVPNDSSSEISSSPSTKTPTLVARLMGLDILPDQSYSPISFSSTLETPYLHDKPAQFRQKNKPGNDFSGTRSLPETPRISTSSARRSVDVEHRLSLQINKENMTPREELIMSRNSSLKRKELKIEEENRSPGHYARQIVKQVKESVSRKVGLDITNTVRNRDHELVNQLKNRKIMSKVLTKVGHQDDSISPGKNSTTSCSPRFKFLEPRNSTEKPAKENNASMSSTSLRINVMQEKTTKVPAKTKLQPVQEQAQLPDQQRPIKKCKKVAEERFGLPPPTRLKKPPQTSDIIRNKQEEPFVHQATVTRANIPDKKCKKTPLSNDLLNISVPTLFPVKKDPTTRPTKIPQKQVPNNAQESKHSSQLSSCSSQQQQSYKEQEMMHSQTATATTALTVRCNNESKCKAVVVRATTTGDNAAKREEHEYISSILKRNGIDKDTPVSFTRWFSPSHPLDPSIFYYLEYFTTISSTTPSFTSQLSQRCNRKLLFHLLDEILVDVIKPYLNLKPWVDRLKLSSGTSGSIKRGSQLVDMLCTKIKSYPNADCRVLEDIDELVEQDMPQSNVQNELAFSEEGEGIVMELEKDLLDTLIQETAVIFYGKE